MQKKIIAFVIFLLGAGLFFLGMLQTNLSCNKKTDSCLLNSRIPALNLTLDKMPFKLSNMKDVTCVRHTQASRGGRRSYYELTLEITGKPYVLETCPNLKLCRRHADMLLDYKYMNKGETFTYKSSVGVSNIMGVILGIALIILGTKMFFDKTEPVGEDEE